MTDNSLMELVGTPDKIAETLENYDTEEAGQDIKEGFREINYDLLSEHHEEVVNSACRAMVRHSNVLGTYQEGVEGATGEDDLADRAAKAMVGDRALRSVKHEVLESDEYGNESASQVQKARESVNDPLVHGTMETIREIGDPRYHLDESTASDFEEDFKWALAVYQN